jgi:DNA polymerase-3 subunit gamma/tau
MAYQVIARKYRPQRFADVVGQEHVTDTLRHAIEQNRIAHAYLFCGPRGTGKTTIARIFAKCLNCTGGPKVDFDDTDTRVIEITEGRAMDVLEIDGASNNGVEQVRELRETCQYVPANGKFKIYIIDEVHMLSTAAFNALLKTLEEPPAHVKFMFATTDPEKVLPTILSRCQRFDLRRIPTALIVKQLQHIAKQERVTIDEAALFAVARGADGGMRDAESALDQLISFCGDKIEEADVLSMFGLTAHGQILELSRAVLAGELHTALHQLHALAQKGKDLGRLLSDLLSHFRNLLLFQVSQGDLKLLEISEIETTSIREQAGLVPADALGRMLEVLADAEIRLRDATSKKILLEVTLLRAIEARNAVSIDSVLKQLNALRGDPGSSVSPTATSSAGTRSTVVQSSEAKATPVTSVASAARAATGPAAPVDVSAATDPATVQTISAASSELETLWAQLLQGVARASKFTHSYLLQAHPVSFARGLFTVGFDPEFADQLSLVDNSRNHELLRTKLAELGHANCQFKFIQAEATAGRAIANATPTPPATAPGPSETATASAKSPAAPSPAPRDKSVSFPVNQDDFKNDPLIQKALEVFKGTIVQVRA